MSVVDALPPRVADLLAAHPEGDDTAGPAAVVRFLRDRPALLRRWVHELRVGGLHDLVKASAWHRNGFAKIVLHESERPRFRIRLHVWPAVREAGARRGDSDAHSHRWPFASSVVAGAGLDTVHFVETAVGGRLHERHLVGPGVDGLRPMGTTRLVAFEGFVRPRSDVYECSSAVVHRIEPRGDGPVATLVVTGAPVEPVSSIFRRPGDRSDPGTRPLAAEELDEVLGTVLRML
jgi:hypothetical protein